MTTPQRLILLFDGTWNDPQDQTNVYRVARRLHNEGGGRAQRFYYSPGVGTARWQRLLGGAFGYGLSSNLLQGYDWLARRYREGDEIWVFGFSRGAYTARSLVGLIRKCGLLDVVTPALLAEAEQLYRDKALHPDSEACSRFKQQYSLRPRIRFLGVWDTVGALGIPGTSLSELGKYSWHDTELSSIVDHARHALALDEHRAAYEATPWTSPDGRQKPGNLRVEQRWFIGAHANVGGGYGDDPLADLPLAWLLKEAAEVGLALDLPSPREDAWQAPPRDSYREFLKGLYAWFNRFRRSGDGRYYRRLDQGNHDLQKRRLPAVNVTVDASVWQRWNRPEFDYRPPTLVRAGLKVPAQADSVDP